MVAKATSALGYKALAAMTSDELVARLKAARRTISIHREHARGCSYYLSIPEVSSEWNQAQYEKRTINKILLRRAHLALEVGLDRDATRAAVAG